jgi:cytochrome c peroxidase
MSRTCHRVAQATLLVATVAACGSKRDRPTVLRDDGGLATSPGRDSAARPGGPVTLAAPPPVPTPPPGRPPLPPGATAPTAAEVALGELLFHERRLGADGTTRCASCHDPAHGFAGVEARSQNALGKPSLRHTPTLLDVAWHPELAWDGRAGDRIKFVMGHATGQLGASLDDTARPLLESPTYRAHVARTGDINTPGHTAGAALTAYAMTRFSPESPWDRQERGVPDAVSAQAIAGYAVFTGKAQCATCHPPPLYTDLGYHRLGLIASPDDGRGRVDPAANGQFKTPTVRGAALRARFFHDGSAASLEAAIDWHLAGGVGQGATAADVDPALPPIQLTADERAALLAFVRALSAPLPAGPPPTLPEDFP